MKVGLAGILAGEPGSDYGVCGFKNGTPTRKPAGLFARVFPTIDPAYSITGIQFSNVADSGGKQVAVDIAFRLTVHASPPQPTGKVQIINAAGKVVKTVASNMTLVAGFNSVRWNLTNDSGAAAPNGNYTAMITASATGASVTASRGGLSVQR